MSRKGFTFLGSFFLLITIIIFSVILFSNDFSITKWLLLSLSLCILSFTMRYLSPRLEDDERAQFIRGKAIYYTFFFALFYLLIGFTIKTWNNAIHTELLFTLFAFTLVLTLCSSIVIIERRN